MANKILSVAEIIEQWPSSYALGSDLGLRYGGDHVRVMKRRKRIPRYYWPTLLKAAHHRGIELNQQTLEAAHSHCQGLAE